MPSKKKKSWPTTPLDPALRAKLMKWIDACETGRWEITLSAGATSKDFAPTMVKAMLRFVQLYETNQLSPTMQKKVVGMMKKAVRNFPDYTFVVK